MDLAARLEKLGAKGAVNAAATAFVASRRTAAAPADAALAGEFEAMIETMVLLAAIDGFVTDDELAQLRSSIEKMVLPESTDRDLDEVLAAILERLTADGWKARVAEVAGRLRSTESRELAFRLGAAVAFVDDDVAEAEAEAIEALAAAFGLSADESQKILQEVVSDLFG